MGESPEEMLRRVSAENALLAAENKKLRAELVRNNDELWELIKRLAKEKKAWRELCGRWIGCALCIRDILKAKGYDITFNMPPEKPEGVL